MKHFVTVMFLAGALQGQQTVRPNLAGAWLGTLDAGIAKLRVSFQVTADERGELHATFDSLDQNRKSAIVQEVSVDGLAVHLKVSGLRASFDGVFAPDGDTLTGTFTQGVSRPLELRRVDRVELLPRPQEPRAPFPYLSTEVSYESRGSRLAGTLTTPSGEGPFAAVILISGMGPQDRDATMAAHKPFWVIADYLTRRGIAVLRMDDRGIGKSEGSFAEQTLEDQAADVAAGLAFLKTQAHLDPNKLGLIGHSEGGIVAPLAAVRSGDVAFLVTLAGMGVPGDELLTLQAETLSRAAGVPEELIAQNRAMQAAVFQVLRSERDPNAATLRLTREIQAMNPAMPLKSLQRRYAVVNAAPVRSMMLANPADVFRQVTIPVLAMGAARDAQVPAAQNLAGVAAALAAGGNADFTVTVLPGLNHSFQTCKSCLPAEQGQLDETFSPAALATMGDWIVRQALRR